MRGTLEPATLVALLRVLFAEQKSGILEITRGAEARKILFQKGAIKFASTNVPEERLGEHLVRSGKLKPADLEKATRQVGRGERLGQILVRLGLLTPDQLQRFAREHILQIIYASFGMEGGEYRFEEVEVPLGQEIKAGLSMGAIIMEAVRRMDPTVAAAALGGGDLVLRPSSDPRFRSQPIALRPQEGFLLSRVDGRTRVDDIVVASPLPAEETLRTLLGLWLAGLVEDSRDPERLPLASTVPRAAAPAASSPGSPPAGGAATRRADPAGMQAARPAAGPGSGSGRAPSASRPPRPPTGPLGRESAQRASASPPAAPSAAPAGPAPRPSAAKGAEERIREVMERFQNAPSQSLYELLGITQTADEADIRRAYYGLAKRFHPDRFQAPEYESVRQDAERLFSMLTEAYNVLTNPEDRQRYEQERSTPEPESAASRHQEQANLARQNFLHGKALLEQGQFHNAVTFFENAVQLDPKRAEYYQYLASVQMKNPKWRQQAESNFQRALEIDPSLVSCYVSLGQIYRRTQQHEQAERMFREALRWDPEHPVAQRELAAQAGDRSKGGVSSMFKGMFKK